MIQSIDGTTVQHATQQECPKPRQALDEAFAQELSKKIDQWIGAPGTNYRAQMEKRVSGLLGEQGADGDRHFDISKLSDGKLADLKKLEKASQDFEAVFVKGLLTQMRRSSFAEKTGEMGSLAKDMMDQAVAESVSRSGNSLGIAKEIFIEMAQRVVKSTEPRTAPDK